MPGELAYEFDLELTELCDLWDTVILENGQRAINSKPIRDSIETYGAVQTGAFYAKGQTPGFDLVGKYLGYEKTLEALVVDPRFAELFDAETVASAQAKLDAAAPG